MVEFNCSRKDMIPAADGSSVYYRGVYEGKNVFIKLMEYDGSPMAEAFVSTLLGYFTNLPKSGFMDYSLCKVHNEYGESIGVFCDLIEQPTIMVSLHDFLADKEDYFRGWQDEFDDFGDFLSNSAVSWLAWGTSNFLSVCRLVSTATGEGTDTVMDYFFKLACIDCIVGNGDRSFDNCALLYNTETGKYSLCPYSDFGNSLYMDEKMTAVGKGGPFMSDALEQVRMMHKIRRGKRLELLKFDVAKYLDDGWGKYKEEEYGLNDFYVKDYWMVCDRMRDTHCLGLEYEPLKRG